jgi:hypothetical protein
MKLLGDIRRIKNRRDSLNQDIEIHLDKIEYITHKKDGRYFQPFEFIDQLDSPLVITGDCLSRSDDKYLEEGEHAFKVYDKAGDTYALNPNKHLSVILEHDFDTAETILTSLTYSVTVSNEEFKQLQSHRPTDKAPPKGKDRRKK